MVADGFDSNWAPPKSQSSNRASGKVTLVRSAREKSQRRNAAPGPKAPLLEIGPDQVGVFHQHFGLLGPESFVFTVANLRAGIVWVV